jgi:hypothetical protein
MHHLAACFLSMTAEAGYSRHTTGGHFLVFVSLVLPINRFWFSPLCVIAEKAFET